MVIQVKKRVVQSDPQTPGGCCRFTLIEFKEGSVDEASTPAPARPPEDDKA